MSKNYDGLARIIIQNVGGKDNIQSLEHCFTRLRFRLKDESKCNTDMLKRAEGVVNVVSAGGQYQIIIGTHVTDVYEAVIQRGHLEKMSGEDGGEEKKGILNSLIDVLSGIFLPAIGLLCACGILKGLLTVATMSGLLSDTDGTYQILYAIGDVMFYFFPIFLGYTAARKFKMNEITGIAVGAVMVYPAMVSLSSAEPVMTLFEKTFLQSNVTATFLKIPVIMNNYASTVIPVVIAVWFASKVEYFLKEHLPAVVRTFILPLITLVITVPITFIVIGPLATWLSLALSSFSQVLFQASPILFGLFLGGFWQIFIMFGVHSGFFPIVINNLATVGYDTIFAATLTCVFAQIAALIAIIIKTRDSKLKGTAVSALFSAIFGITEPAIYGVTLPLKKTFAVTCIASAVGGAVAVSGGTRYFFIGGQGIFSFLCYVNPDGTMNSLIFSLIGVAVTMIISFAATMFLMKKEPWPAEMEKTSSGKRNITITSPLKGEVVRLDQMEDPAFAEETLGKGAAIISEEGVVCSPFDGTVQMVFETGHAIGLVSDEGVELMIHIGIDTVRLDGKYFEKLVKDGERVAGGQPLIKFDIEKITKEGYQVITPVVITNTETFADISVCREGSVGFQENLMSLVKEG